MVRSPVVRTGDLRETLNDITDLLKQIRRQQLELEAYGMVTRLALGAALAVLLPWMTRGFWPDRPRLADPVAALRLVVVVLGDIVTANLLVARQVLGPPSALRPDFLDVPLDIADPFVATMLGSIVSLTPGTVSVEIDGARGVLLG